jgi:hypothetical protein
LSRNVALMGRNLGEVGVSLLLLAGCSGQPDAGEPGIGTSQESVKVITIDPRRSLAVTEKSILTRFPLQRVLTQLATQAGTPSITALQLFQQWWDTQNPKPPGPPSVAPHCDDSVDPLLGSVVNGFPYLCRYGAEGAQATCDPFAPASACAYIPIGLFNRFDQAPENGAHCGEYRIVYAKESGVTSTSDRNLLIFEAVLPNPHPQQGIKGCQQIVDTWSDLSTVNDVQARATALEHFYFDGSGVVGPVISVTNFGDNPLGVGQIRTNQFSNTTTGWSLREFKLLRKCTGGTCTAPLFTPVSDKNNAYGPLFAPSSSGVAFASFFPTQVPSLSATSLAGLDISVPNSFNTGQSQASGATAAEMRYLDQLNLDQLSGTPSTLRTNVQSALTSAGSSLTVPQIVLRAQALSCAGCHKLNNDVDLGGGLIWPKSLGFTHVTERETETVGGQERFRISDTLTNVLLPARQQIFEDFLNNRPRPSKGPDHPLSGSRSHG